MRVVIAEPLELLNQRVSSPEVREYLDGLGGGPIERDDQGDEEFLNLLSAGLSLIHQSGVINTVFLFASTADGFSAFSGGLPLGLRVEDSQADVRRKLGAPQSERPAGFLKSLRRRGPCDRFDRPEFSVGVDYEEHGDRIRKIIIMLAVAVPEDPGVQPVQ